uniref:Nonstructural protein n=1 Tax=Dulem virus 149 TaxID=3145626 RepID=A0AAU8B1F3_9VIRU
MLKCFSVYDKKSESFNTPFFAPTYGVAVRSFTDLALNRETVVGQHPEDFDLYCVGSFDDSTGNVAECREYLCNALNRIQIAMAEVQAPTDQISDSSKTEAPQA